MSEIAAVIRHSAGSYVRNIQWILFFSIPFFFALAIPFFSPLPSYVSLGATFLRTGSIPGMALADFFVVTISFLASLYLVSFAVVSINLVVKSQRTMTNIKSEVLQGIEKYTFAVFLFFLITWVFLLAASIASYEFRLERIVTPLFSLVFYSVLFYVPAAMVIDEVKPGRAVEVSLKMLSGKPLLFLAWILLGFVFLSIADFAALLIFASPFAQYAVLLVNSFFILPMLTLMQSQIYLTKYTLL